MSPDPAAFEDQLWSRALEQYGSQFDEIERAHWWFAGRRAVILAALARFVTKGSRVLDFGCGAGGLTAELARVYAVVGVDFSAPAVAVAQGRGLDVRLLGPADTLPSGFDAVCAFDVLEHVEDDAGELRRLASSVRPGGIVMVTVPAYRLLWGRMDEVAGHVRRYRLRQLDSTMRKAGLRRVHASYFNSWLFPVVALGRLAGFPRENHEIDLPPRPLNALLRAAFSSEAPLAARLTLPFGVSILYLARRATI
jgi:2-polyprenyl-3-methyl-5-hydroxy-6-metoxy-1,4-benzoquinol methylase